MSGAIDSLSPAQIRRAVALLDANHDRRIEFPEVNLDPAHVQAIGSDSDDYVEVSRTASAMGRGRVSFDLSGDTSLADRIARSVDRNRNGRIDASEIRFSAEAREALTMASGKPVTVQDLAEGFYTGLLKLGLRIYDPSAN